MIQEFRLPDLGEGLTESEIVTWHVAVGDTVTLNQVIADVETAKAVVELPSPYAGIVSRLHEPAGTVVEVGAPIVSFDVGGSPAPDVAAAPGTVDSSSGGTAGTGTAHSAPSGSGGGEPLKRTPNLVGTARFRKRPGVRRGGAGSPGNSLLHRMPLFLHARLHTRLQRPRRLLCRLLLWLRRCRSRRGRLWPIPRRSIRRNGRGRRRRSGNWPGSGRQFGSRAGNRS